MVELVRSVAKLVNITTNPISLILDRLGLKKQPYLLMLKNKITIELRPGWGDRYSFFETFIRGDYTDNGQLLAPGDTVIDVGANIGCFTIYAAKRVGTLGKVIALEPDENSFRQLTRNLQLNSLSNVVPLRLAVGGHEGTVSFHSSELALFSSTYASVNGVDIGGTVQEVSMTTLNTIMNDHGVRRCDYLKLDCEGAEYEIIRTLSAEIGSRIEQITMEIHRVSGGDPTQMRQNLRDLGFALLHRGNVSYLRRVGDGIAPVQQPSRGESA